MQLPAARHLRLSLSKMVVPISACAYLCRDPEEEYFMVKSSRNRRVLPVLCSHSSLASPNIDSFLPRTIAKPAQSSGEDSSGCFDLSLQTGAITVRSGGGVLRARTDSLLRVTDDGPCRSASDHLRCLAQTTTDGFGSIVALQGRA